MESEHIIYSLAIYVSSYQDLIIAVIQFFAPHNTNLLEVGTQRYKISQPRWGDARATQI